MQNLETVPQKMAELPLDAPETLTKKSHNLSGQSIRTYMQTLDSVAQKTAELPLDASEIPLLIPYELPCKIWSL